MARADVIRGPHRAPAIVLRGTVVSSSFLRVSPSGGSNRDASRTRRKMTLVILRIALVLAAVAPAAFAQVSVAPNVLSIDLAGRSVLEYPWFSFENCWFEGAPIEIAIDTAQYPVPVGWSANVYLVAHKSAAQWLQDRGLVDVRGAPHTIQIQPGGIEANRFTVDGGTLSGDAGAGLGVPYDVVIDFDLDGTLSVRDFVDGVSEDPGLYVLRPTTLPGPYTVVETIYSGGSFLGQDLYYPANIAALGALPIVVVSHGNGHDYTWYDHIGYHLASYGFIVMSHQNNTVPGIETASTTTLTNTEYLLSHLTTIAGGALQNHVDVTRIAWIGHSRGAEGVVRAYDRIFDGTYVPVNFTLSGIRLVSSIAPTDFLGVNSANPHGVPFSLWVGSADDDVSGCADCEQCQSFHLHDRATGTRQSISIQGVGHGAFHNGGGSTVAAGPCQLSRTDTHAIMKAYLLPLAKRYLEGNEAARDCLWRHWETFHSPGTSESLCANVELMFREDPAAGNFVIDDFQAIDGTGLSSSGAAVVGSISNLVEGRFDDPNGDFTHSVSDPMNGITLGGVSDTSRGIVFEWSNYERFLSFDLVPAVADVTPYEFLSFRAAQLPRAPNTLAALNDVTFAVRLADANGVENTIRFRTFGGGLEEPYLRSGCGSGIGWGSEFETVRLRLSDFRRDAVPLDLTRLSRIDFLFGAENGSPEGRIAFDELTLCRR